MTPHNHAAYAYARLAPFYDRFAASHNHAAWAATLEQIAQRHGLRGRRLLDVACGTGNSLIPFLERGYEAAGCDLSAEMLALARRKVGRDVPLFKADVRQLPRSGPYDLVVCAGDVLNYLLSPAELVLAFRSMASVLAPGGKCVFDVNTLGAYATVFASDRVIESDDRGLLLWHGSADPDPEAGARVEVTIEAFTRRGELWERVSSTHSHRAHSDGEVLAALSAAGLECVAVYGVTPDGSLHLDASEREHTKRVYAAGRPMEATQKGERDASDHEAGVAGRPGGRLQQGQLAVKLPPGVNAGRASRATADRGPRR